VPATLVSDVTQEGQVVDVALFSDGRAQCGAPPGHGGAGPVV